MSLYVVEDKDCNLLMPNGFFTNEVNLAALYDEPIEPESNAKQYGGHVVELVEKPAPMVMPEWLDEWIQKYEDNLPGAGEKQTRLRIIGKICQSGWGITFNDQLNRDVPDRFNPFDLDDSQLKYVHEHQDELVRALSLNSWTVEKPKRYVLPMEGTSQWGDDGKHKYAFIIGRNSIGPEWAVTEEAHSSDVPMPSVTQADIDDAPKWVRDLEKVEVHDEK